MGPPELFRGPGNRKWPIRKMLIVSLYDHVVPKVSLHYR